jgi:FMN-dependent NADH-azoreductase
MGQGVQLSEDWAQAMGEGNERTAGGEGHDGEPVRHSCWRTRRHLRRQQPRPLQISDLGQSPPPHVGQAFITGMYAAPEQRTPEQAKTVALSDALIDELFAADTIVRC